MPPGHITADNPAGEPPSGAIVAYAADFARVTAYTGTWADPVDGQMAWLAVTSTPTTAEIRRWADRFGIPAPILERIQNRTPDASALQQGPLSYLSLPVLTCDDDGVSVTGLHIFADDGVAVSVAAAEAWPVATLRDRIVAGLGYARLRSARYVLSALSDLCIDEAFRTIESVDERMESIEDRLDESLAAVTPSDIRLVRHDVTLIRRYMAGLRATRTQRVDVLRAAVGDRLDLAAEIEAQFRSLQDEADRLRERAIALAAAYQAAVSLDMNAGMRVLTVTATIFIPLTFLAGIYGMNFEAMPELGWRFGYPVVLTVMAIVAVVLFLRFKRRGWF